MATPIVDNSGSKHGNFIKKIASDSLSTYIMEELEDEPRTRGELASILKKPRTSLYNALEKMIRKGRVEKRKSKITHKKGRSMELFGLTGKNNGYWKKCRISPILENILKILEKSPKIKADIAEISDFSLSMLDRYAVENKIEKRIVYREGTGHIEFCRLALYGIPGKDIGYWGDELSEHPRRERLLKLFSSNPGIEFGKSDIRRCLSVKDAVYFSSKYNQHIRSLVTSGKIKKIEKDKGIYYIFSS